MDVAGHVGKVLKCMRQLAADIRVRFDEMTLA